MSALKKLVKGASIFDVGNPAAQLWSQGEFDREEVNDFEKLKGKGLGMSPQAKAEYRAREAAKKHIGKGLAVQSPLTSTYS